MGKALQKRDAISMNVSTWRFLVDEGREMGPNVFLGMVCPASLSWVALGQWGACGGAPSEQPEHVSW